MSVSTLVVGDDGINTLGLIRSLGEAGYKPDLIITDSKQKAIHTIKSGYINKFYVTEKEESSLLDRVKSIPFDNLPAYLFPASDFVLSVIDKYRAELESRYILPAVSNGTASLTELMSKNRMSDCAEKAGFSVPKKRLCLINENSFNDTELLSYFENEYPLILKADSNTGSGTDFIIFNTADELKKALKQHTGETVLIQKYIKGAREIAVQGVAFGDSGKPFVCGMVNKIRTSVFAMGTTTYAELKPVEAESIKNACEKFAEITGYSGIFDLDILTDGKCNYFIECNFRNGSNGYAFTRSGVNLPDLWIKGTDKSGNKEVTTTKIFINEFSDFAHVMRHELPVLKWLYQFVAADCRLSFSFRDQRPFWSEAVNYFRK